jgi:hypothetical protein
MLPVVRAGVAIVLAGLALAGAVYLGSLRLAEGHGYCTGISTGFGLRGGCATDDWKHVRRRAGWQIPAAIVIAAVGLGAAVVVARGD